MRHGIFALIVLLAASTAMAQPSEPEGIAATESTADTFTSTPDTTAGSGAREGARPVSRFKKAVTFTRFHVANSLHVEDIADIWDGYPLELMRRLEARGIVVARHSTTSLLTDPRNFNPDAAASRELIRRIAEQNGSQFVISGLILDAAVSNESLRPYFGWQGRETGRRFELGLPWNSVVAGIRPVPSERRLEVEIFLHDGLTGALLTSHRDNVEISGRVAVGRNRVFASASFFDTPFGQAVERILNTQTGLIDDDLASLPFVANIVRIEGRKVFIDAGNISALRPGDKFKVYHRNTAIPVESPAATLGISDSAASTLTLNQVHPLFAVGDLAADPSRANIQVGDIVRFEAAARK